MQDDRRQPTQPTLFDLHDCMQEAVFEEPIEPVARSRDLRWVEKALISSTDELEPLAQKSMSASFIVDRLTMLKLHVICRTNGTSASAFLRQCARRLVAEYEPER